jgi:hypothetical protein
MYREDAGTKDKGKEEKSPQNKLFPVEFQRTFPTSVKHTSAVYNVKH